VVEEPLIEMPRLPVVNAPAVEAPVAPVVNPSAGAPMAAGPDPAVLLAAAPPTGGEAPVDLPAEGGLSASVHRVFDAFLPPAFVAVVVSPFVVLQALAEALSSSGLGLALPAAVFGLGLAGRRTRRWLLAYGRGDAPR
ncbi:MAG TPA: hypothetical protein VLL51_06300, partial [Gemmatimonadales bacterium]|nr:hypothetical protein [Gemmatimonadales bacterium]